MMRLLRISHNHDVFAGTSVALLLARLALDYIGVCIVFRLLLQLAMLLLELLGRLLGALQTLRKLAIRPRLSQRAEQKRRAHQARHPDHSARKQRQAAYALATLRLLNAHC